MQHNIYFFERNSSFLLPYLNVLSILKKSSFGFFLPYQNHSFLVILICQNQYPKRNRNKKNVHAKNAFKMVLYIYSNNFINFYCQICYCEPNDIHSTVFRALKFSDRITLLKKIMMTLNKKIKENMLFHFFGSEKLKEKLISSIVKTKLSQ